MPETLKSLEPILSEIYRESINAWFADMNKEIAMMHGWKRPRQNRIKWADVQKNKVRKFIRYEKIRHEYDYDCCHCWRCRLYRRIDCW